MACRKLVEPFLALKVVNFGAVEEYQMFEINDKDIPSQYRFKVQCMYGEWEAW
jgi:hypothetical protein